MSEDTLDMLELVKPSNAFDEYTRKSRSNCSNTCDRSDRIEYLQSSTIDITADPLEFWEINKNEYPCLYKVFSLSLVYICNSVFINLYSCDNLNDFFQLA